MKNGKSTQKQVEKKIGTDESIDSFTAGYVRKIARKLIGKHGFTESDRQDIEQKIYQKLARFLPCNNHESPRWKAFVALTSKRCVASMIRDQRAQKRDYRRTISIHVVLGVDTDGLIELAQTIHEGEIPSRKTEKHLEEHELSDLKMDTEICLENIEDESLRELCHRVKHQSISQVAREMNVPRTTIHSWLRGLRQHFVDHGLKDYL